MLKVIPTLKRVAVVLSVVLLTLQILTTYLTLMNQLTFG